MKMKVIDLVQTMTEDQLVGFMLSFAEDVTRLTGRGAVVTEGMVRELLDHELVSGGGAA